MSYRVIQAQSYWDCLGSMPYDDRYRERLRRTLVELAEQPFHNARLSTHDIGKARNGRALFSSDVGGRRSDRRVVWQLYHQTIVVLLYGTHKVQDRARRMQITFDEGEHRMTLMEAAPSEPHAPSRPYAEERATVGRLFAAWTDRELTDLGFGAPAVATLRGLNTIDELFAPGAGLAAGDLDAAFTLIAPAADRTTDDAPPRPPAEEPAVATEPVPTEEDRHIERLLHDRECGADFTAVEPEYMADILGKPIEDWMVFLHPAQRQAANGRYNGPMQVRGAAGTGKTVVGLHRARALAGRLPDDAAPVLCTTYVASLPPVLAGLYNRLPGARGREVVFSSVDSVARWVCASMSGTAVHVNTRKVDKAFDAAFRRTVTRGTPLGGAFSAQYLREEITSVIKGRPAESLDEYEAMARTGRHGQMTVAQRRQVWELMRRWDAEMERHGTVDFADVIVMALEQARRRSSPSYSSIIVDEAQDLTLSRLQLLRALVNAPDYDTDRPDGLCILSDGAQRIYPGGFTLRQAGIEVRGRSVSLTVNYRNTTEIIDAALAVAGGEEVSGLNGPFRRDAAGYSTVRAGRRPLLLRVDGVDPQIETTARLAERYAAAMPGCGLGDMAILAETNQAAQRALRRLKARGTPAQGLADYTAQTNDQIKVGTHHRAKGLEFKGVFVLLSSRFPDVASSGAEPEAAEARHLALSQMFVAMTRARDLLVVMHEGEACAEVAAAAAHFSKPPPSPA